MTRPSAGDRLRAAPPVVWLYAGAALLAVPYVGIVVNRYAVTEPGAWYGVGFALVLSVGLALRWRVMWPLAFLVEGYLLLVGLWIALQEPAVGLGLSVKAVVAWGLLLAPATRLHVFGSVVWQDPDDEVLDPDG